MKENNALSGKRKILHDCFQDSPPFDPKIGQKNTENHSLYTNSLYIYIYI